MRAVSLRVFLGSVTRWVGVGGFLGLLLAEDRKRRRLEKDPECIRLLTCSDCAQFAGCNRQKAETFRRERDGTLAG